MARETQIPVPVKNAVVCASTDLESVASHHQSQIILQRPAVLDETDHLTAFKRAHLKTQKALCPHVDEGVGRGLVGRITLDLRVVEPVMGQIHFVGHAGIEGVCFYESQIVLILCAREGDVGIIRQQAAAAEFVQERIPGNVRHETEAVRITEVLVHAAIVGTCRGSLRVREGKAPDGKARACAAA